MAKLQPGKYLLLSVPHDHQRMATPVTLLGPVAMEVHYYRVRMPDGHVEIANDSLLEPPDTAS